MGRTSKEDRDALTTREIVILTAEKLFAERGIDAVSLREVIQAAGQRNMGLVQYYFGGKDGLVGAIFVRRSAVTDARRRFMLDEVEAAVGVDIRSLASAVVLPLAEQMQRGNHYVEFCSRLLVERGRQWMGEVAAGDWSDTYDRLADLLCGAVDGMARPVAVRRVGLAVDLAVHALASRVRGRQDSRPGSAASDPFVDDLVAVVASVLATAPARRRSRGRVGS